MNVSGAQEKYIRLTRRKRTWMGFTQAWLGADHLLIVQSIRYVERYRRFAFSDIQAVVVTEGGERIMGIVLAIVACVFGWALVDSPFARGFFATLGAIVLAFLIFDVARGPRCLCFLQTAVSRERLLCVSHMRTARSFLAALRPAIEAVQGATSSAPLAEIPAPEPATGLTSIPTPQVDAVIPRPEVAFEQPPVLERRLSYAPEILFALLLLDSVLMFVALRSTIGVAFGILPTLYIAEFLLGILALIQSRARNAALLTVLIAAFLCVLIDPFALSGAAAWPSVVSTFREAPSGVLSWNIPIKAPPTTTLLTTSWRAALGAAGLLVCYFERTTARP